LHLVPSVVPGEFDADELAPVVIRGCKATRLFDRLVEAQSALQHSAKTDPTWIKRR
jgi:hypothetical protein